MCRDFKNNNITMFTQSYEKLSNDVFFFDICIFAYKNTSSKSKQTAAKTADFCICLKMFLSDFILNNKILGSYSFIYIIEKKSQRFSFIRKINIF